MKHITLHPEQIIVPGEFELGNESILKIYFRVFQAGKQDCLPPVLVTKFEDSDKRTVIDWLENPEYGYPKLEEEGNSMIMYREGKEKLAAVQARRKDYTDLFSILKKSPYMLIDGNHRTTAATLTHQPISALEIELDKDLNDIQDMINKGYIFDFKREEKYVFELKRAFVCHCLNVNYDSNDKRLLGIYLTYKSMLRYTKNIKERVEELITSKEIPQYMMDYFLSQSH